MSVIKADNFTWRNGEATAQVSPTITGEQLVRGVAKSWLNYNGVTPAVRANFNISSVTKNGTGRYTPFFVTAMIDANYSIQLTVAGTGSYSDWSRSHWYVQSAVITTSFSVENVDETDNYFDTSISTVINR